MQKNVGASWRLGPHDTKGIRILEKCLVEIFHVRGLNVFVEGNFYVRDCVLVTQTDRIESNLLLGRIYETIKFCLGGRLFLGPADEVLRDNGSRIPKAILDLG